MSTKDVFIDIETYSSVDLKEAGLYKYVESPDFEILLISYAVDHGPVITIDLTETTMPEDFEDLLFDETVRKHAHNAMFERVCFKRVGYDIPANEWYCTAIKAAYCGYPFALAQVSAIMNLTHKKLDTGKDLIKLFSTPCKPTGSNKYKTRVRPHDYIQKWLKYIEYNVEDVEAEREIYYKLLRYEIPKFEHDLYVVDQAINDRGVYLNMQLVKNAISLNTIFTERLKQDVLRIAGIVNPGSAAQVKAWIERKTGEPVTSLTVETVPLLLKKYKDKPEIVYILQARQMLSKSSIAKYDAMLACKTKDGTAKGLFQFYGANRTGRWAGRLVQLHNLKRNSMDNLNFARELVLKNDLDGLDMAFFNVSKVLSELIRTALEARADQALLIADYSAIEARVTAWLADERWRLEVFRTHGKIYEASASQMFGIPLESITKDSDYRQKGKVAELALGYGGSLGAMVNMGGEKMGLSTPEMMSIVRRWRKANPNIVAMWSEFDECAVKAVQFNTEVESRIKGITFDCDGSVMTIKLPNGRKLFYVQPEIVTGKYGSLAVQYKGMNQEKKIWSSVDTYGGKLTENIVQAISRDIMGYAMLEISKRNYNIVLHVHDELGIEHPIEKQDEAFADICEIMGKEIEWAPGLPLGAAGFITSYYKKD